MKICKKCNIEKPLTDYYKDSQNVDKLKHLCKGCHRINSVIWMKKNPEQRKIHNKRAKQKRKDKISIYNHQYHKENKESINAARREKRKLPEHKAVINFHCAQRKIRVKRASPPWIKNYKTEMKGFFKRASFLSNYHGVDFEVDHIVPLTGKLVSGLNVPWNLRVITAKENNKKRNRFE